MDDAVRNKKMHCYARGRSPVQCRFEVASFAIAESDNVNGNLHHSDRISHVKGTHITKPAPGRPPSAEA